MTDVRFTGQEPLIALLDALVPRTDVSSIAALEDQVGELVRRGAVDLPARIAEVRGEHYARRELYRSPTHGYTVLAVTWGAGQGAPLHDHDGMWGVEVVVKGMIEITSFALRDRRDGLYGFSPRDHVRAGPGVGSHVLPLHNYHMVVNPSPDAAAISLHIYNGALEKCGVFDPCSGGYFRRRTRLLELQ